MLFILYLVCSVILDNHRIEHHPTAATICREDLSGPLGVHHLYPSRPPSDQRYEGLNSSLWPWVPFAARTGHLSDLSSFGWLSQPALSLSALFVVSDSGEDLIKEAGPLVWRTLASTPSLYQSSA